jgi:hypothetical protein
LRQAVNITTLLAVLVALSLLVAFGQDSINATADAGAFRGSVHFGSPDFSNPVIGAPYSGEVVTETVQTLADGTHTTRTKVYRDSLGRTRKERSPLQVSRRGGELHRSVGNDRPMIAVFESWRSPELQVPLLMKSNEPRSGDRTEKLTNSSRTEPDQSLFNHPGLHDRR